MRADGIPDDGLQDMMDGMMKTVNRSMPAYSKLAKVEVMPEPFEKTPKMSIKRFLYS